MTLKNNSLKQYDTLLITGQYTDETKPAGEDGLSLEGVDIMAHLNTKRGALVDELKVTITNLKNGVFTCQPTLKKLPVGTLSVDISLHKNGIRKTFDTININIVKAETNPYLHEE